MCPPGSIFYVPAGMNFSAAGMNFSAQPRKLNISPWAGCGRRNYTIRQ
jgi:hypothetical protein